MRHLHLFAQTILLSLLFSISLFSQGVKVGGTPGNPHPAAGLELDFTDRGFLLPRLTTTQRNALPQPTAGLAIFNLTTDCVEMYFSTGWQQVRCGCTQPPAAPSGITPPSPLPCPGASAQVFSVNPVANATGYQWTLPAGANLVSGQGTNSITIDFPASSSGNIDVVATNGCGSSAPFTYALQVQPPSASFSPLSGAAGFPVVFQGPPGLSYAWTFASGTPATSQVQQPSVQWNTPGNYSVSLQTTDANGCTATQTQTVSITNCPPGSQTFSYTGSIVNWTVPACVSQITIEARGAEGGQDQNFQLGGRGAQMTGTFSVVGGSTLRILVGQKGTDGVAVGFNRSGAGGGGSFVWVDGSNLLLIAAGGGGGKGNSSTIGNTNASAGTSGENGFYPGGTNGSGGTGGTSSNSDDGGGGAGWNSNGTGTGGGIRPLAGGAGGTNNRNGGFGGGGGSTNSAGGGGGYSGGGGGNNGANNAGGGGSFNGGTNQINLSGVQTGNGLVTITW
jgi:hypothetical protein